MEVDVNLFEKSEGSMWTPSTRGETETIKALTTQVLDPASVFHSDLEHQMSQPKP